MAKLYFTHYVLYLACVIWVFGNCVAHWLASVCSHCCCAFQLVVMYGRRKGYITNRARITSALDGAGF